MLVLPPSRVDSRCLIRIGADRSAAALRAIYLVLTYRCPLLGCQDEE